MITARRSILKDAIYGFGIFPEISMAATINFIIKSNSFPLFD